MTESQCPTYKLRQLVPRLEKIHLGDNLVMRWSTSEDMDAIAECLSAAFQFEDMARIVPEGQLPGKNEYLVSLTSRLMKGDHPFMSQYDFVLIEDKNVLQAPKPGQPPRPLVVATTCLLMVTGHFDSIDMHWGMPGAVGTRPSYRNRGLVKRMFLDLIHPASEARGDLMLLIAGIPYFYKQFGYENALPAMSGRLLKNIANLYPPHSTSGEKLPRFTLRDARSSDIPYLIRLSRPNRLFSKAEVGTPYDLAFWTFVVKTLSRENISDYYNANLHAGIVVDSETSKDVGITLTSMVEGIWCWKIFVLDEDEDHKNTVTYRAVMDEVLAQLKEFDRSYFECYNTKLNDNILPSESETALRIRGEYPALDFTNLVIHLTPKHPMTQLLDAREQIDPAKDPYRFYTRIPSLPKFLLKIAPVLERRLKESVVWQDINARLQIDFYQRLEGMSGRGLEIVLKDGKVVQIDDWKPKNPEQLAREAVEMFKNTSQLGDPRVESNKLEEDEVVLMAWFRPLSFIRLATGAISVDEILKHDLENYVGSKEAKILLEALFPALDEFHLDLTWA
ncbi:hypothetical protein FBU30_009701 [Linnemannia zychae]|nr:hypothetical protein FBU30_009701 [Linnemannia zychae]